MSSVRRACLASLVAALVVSGPTVSSQQVFRAGADATSVHVSVRQRGQPVPGLTAADFELTDNGVPQVIDAVTAGSVPIDVTLVLDTSASVSGPAIAQIRSDVQRISARLTAEDRVRVLSFSATVREAHPMRALIGQTELHLAAEGATAFYHALLAALLPPSEAGRPHLVVAMSDGDDNVSLLDGRDVLELARRSDAVLYVVLRATVASMGGTGWIPYSSPGDRNLVSQATEVTGGRVSRMGFVAADVRPDNRVVEEFTKIIDEFRSSYVLWFKPSGVMLPGWHDLTVRVKRGNPTVTHRKGYFGR
jgi:VWFA-related protein